jgi:molybdopterin-synthase adenylyltransferase
VTERYLRHNLIDWFDQSLLKQLNVMVVGAGAVGNEVIKNLALLGVGAIRIVDFDRIEAHNLTRTALFTEADIGKPKADVAAAAVTRLDPNCRVEAICGDFWECIRFAQLQETSALLCCVDNFEARLRINRLCSLLGVDLINAGIDSRAVSAEIFPFMRDPDSACLECNLPPSTYQRVAERYSCGWLRKVAFEEKKIPTTAITASYAGALATSLLLHSFRPEAEEAARRVFIDTISNTTSKASLPKNRSCPCCGAHSPKRIFLQSRRTISATVPWLPESQSDVTLILSDPVLISWETPNCPDCSGAPSAIVFELASRYTDADATCQKCGLKQRLALIRDQFTASELAEKFNGRNMPGKYISYESGGTQVIIELRD